jgi:hypothetical protein
MLITKESIDRFAKQFILPRHIIDQFTPNTIQYGTFEIVRDINIIDLIVPMLPKVIFHIINDYYDNDRITLNYELTYPYYYDGFIPIMLSINCDEYKFNHDICIGRYNMCNDPDRTYVDMIPVMLCPHIHTSRISNKDIVWVRNHFKHIRSKSYNDNIMSNVPSENIYRFNFISLFEHIVNAIKPIFVSEDYMKKCKSTIRNISDKVIRITHPDGKTIDITIINENNLNVCISIHMALYDLLKNVQQRYLSM